MATLKSTLILWLLVASCSSFAQQTSTAELQSQAAQTVQQVQIQTGSFPSDSATSSMPNVRDMAAQAAVAAQSANLQMQAAQATADARTRSDAEAKAQGGALKAAVDDSTQSRQKFMQDMFNKNLPADVAARKRADNGERVLFFASKAMTDGDMRSLMQDALANPKISIIFRGGDPEGGADALSKWLVQVAHGLPKLPPISIDPPSYHKYHITQVPEAVVLRDGKEVARVGGVYSIKWIDEALESHSGDLGTYGQMSTPVEPDMEQQLDQRIKSFDWQGYARGLAANFWKSQKTADVPHATKAEQYDLDPTFTVTHDIQLPDGRYLAHAGDRVNPLKNIPFSVTLLVIDASDPAQRAFAAEQVKKDPMAKLRIMSTTVPADASDGWAAWDQWQEQIGAHLYFYSTQYADRLRLSGTPSFVSGNGLTLKVRQVVVASASSN